jgi:hypothetical protein
VFNDVLDKGGEVRDGDVQHRDGAQGDGGVFTAGAAACGHDVGPPRRRQRFEEAADGGGTTTTTNSA